VTPEELLASANRVARAKVHRAGLLKIIRDNEQKEEKEIDN
jgi:hypothetical protein